MGRDCASERGQRLELGRLRGTLRRRRVLEERAPPSPGQFAERLGGPGGTGKAGTQRRVTSIGPMGFGFAANAGPPEGLWRPMATITTAPSGSPACRFRNWKSSVQKRARERPFWV
jgi:hypothetical protein